MRKWQRLRTLYTTVDLLDLLYLIILINVIILLYCKKLQVFKCFKIFSIKFCDPYFILFLILLLSFKDCKIFLFERYGFNCENYVFLIGISMKSQSSVEKNKDPVILYKLPDLWCVVLLHNLYVNWINFYYRTIHTSYLYKNLLTQKKVTLLRSRSFYYWFV